LFRNTAKRKKGHTVTDFAGHYQLSSVVTQSQTIFGWSQVVVQVAALSTMHIAVTIPWASCIFDDCFWPFSAFVQLGLTTRSRSSPQTLMTQHLKWVLHRQLWHAFNFVFLFFFWLFIVYLLVHQQRWLLY